MAENKMNRRDFVGLGLGGLGAILAAAFGFSCSSIEGEEVRGNYSGTGTVTKVKNCKSGCGHFEGDDMVEVSVRYSLPENEGNDKSIEDKVVVHRLACGDLTEGQKVTVNFGKVYEIHVTGGLSQKRDYILTDRYRIKGIEKQID
jgi:hypothetical protein